MAKALGKALGNILEDNTPTIGKKAISAFAPKAGKPLLLDAPKKNELMALPGTRRRTNPAGGADTGLFSGGMGVPANFREAHDLRFQKNVSAGGAADSGLFSGGTNTPGTLRQGQEMRYQKNVSDAPFVANNRKKEAYAQQRLNGPKPESEKRRNAKQRAKDSATGQPSGPTIEAGMDDRGFYDSVARHTQAGYQNSEDLKNVQKAGAEAWSNLKGKDSWQSVAGAAGMGAVAGGLTGAGINTLRGEDAWDGAKSGAFMGAVTMGGIKGVRTATGATAKQTMGEGASAFNQKTGLTKSVKSIFDNERNAKIAKDFMKAQQTSAQ